MKYRSKIDIIASLLDGAMEGSPKTRLFRHAMLSWDQLETYITFLEQKKLLLYDPSLKIYKLTEKGLHFINAYRQIAKLLGGGSIS